MIDLVKGKWYLLLLKSERHWLMQYDKNRNGFICDMKCYCINTGNYYHKGYLTNLDNLKSIMPAEKSLVLQYFPDEKFDNQPFKLFRLCGRR